MVVEDSLVKNFTVKTPFKNVTSDNDNKNKEKIPERNGGSVIMNASGMATLNSGNTDVTPGSSSLNAGSAFPSYLNSGTPSSAPDLKPADRTVNRVVNAGNNMPTITGFTMNKGMFSLGGF